jgi:hypothetical protein
MSTITTTATRTSTTQAAARTRVPTWRSGLGTGAVAAAATSAVVVALRTAGVDLNAQGEPIPLAGFAQMVMLGAVIGIVLARHLRRTAFLWATAVLTALSCVPSVAWGTGAGSKLALVLTHLVAAAIVVPVFARRLSD